MSDAVVGYGVKMGSMRWPGKCPLSGKEWSFLQGKYHLSARELQVAMSICSGCDNREVAESLGVGLNTAKLYIRNLYRRVGVNDRVLLLLRFLSDVSGVDCGR